MSNKEVPTIWKVTELIESIRFQMLTCGTGYFVGKGQLDKLEELIDEIYIQQESD